MSQIITDKETGWQTVYLTRGDYYVIQADELMDAEGTEYTISEGDVLTLTVRELPSEDSDVIFSVSSLAGSNRIVIQPEDTRGAEYGFYSADIQLRFADGRPVTVWPKLPNKYHGKSRNFKNFVLDAEVTIP